jgi:hypothetical protein
MRTPWAAAKYWLFEEPPVLTEEDIKRADAIAGLRALADLLERCPDAKPLYSTTVYHTIYPWDHKDPKAEFIRVMRSIGGKWEKLPEGDQFKLVQQMAGEAKYILSVAREVVCERRVVGSQMVERSVERSVERYVPPPTELVREDIVEWDCPEILR